MPWCEECAKYHAPSAMTAEGACPTCRRILEAPNATPKTDGSSAPITAKNLDLKRLAAGDDADTTDDASAPWHFKLLMVLLVLYFIWRIIDLFR